ncbi:MAG: AAA family ATPase [Bacteroidales bacterium]|nr:AAA family ATPase [Bacteroidales bacterium]
MKLKLNEIRLTGYKSIDSEQKIPINEDVTVLIGANGVGKSNLISFFQMLGFSITGSLQRYVAEHGFANSFLHYGSKQTPSMSARLAFSDEHSKDEYFFRLTHAAGDVLIYTEETLSILQDDKKFKNPFVITMDVGRKESQLMEQSMPGKPHKNMVQFVLSLLKGCQYFQFHDTSSKSEIKQHTNISNNRMLRSDAGNLAAFLYGIKTKKDGKPYYDRIIRYIQQVFPQFGDFVMLPTVQNEYFVNLDWKEKENENIFGAHQISDGTLRFMALATLLLQPADTMPPIIVLDEPELGLHPTAIDILAGMIKKASAYAQVVVATQSPRLIDEFTADKIVVVERSNKDKCSTFKKLDEVQLKDWLDSYTTSELWDKNVIGGRP